MESLCRGHWRLASGVAREKEEDRGEEWPWAWAPASDLPSGETWRLRLFQPRGRGWTELQEGPGRPEHSVWQTGTHARGTDGVCCFLGRSHVKFVSYSVTDVSRFNVKMPQVSQLMLRTCSCVSPHLPEKGRSPFSHRMSPWSGRDGERGVLSTPHTDSLPPQGVQNAAAGPACPSP